MELRSSCIAADKRIHESTDLRNVHRADPRSDGSMERRKHAAWLRTYGNTEPRIYGIMESRRDGIMDTQSAELQIYGFTEAQRAEIRNYGKTE